MRGFGRLLWWLLMLTVWGGLAIALVLLWFTWDMPRPSSAVGSLRRPSLVLTDQSGRSFTHFGDLSGSILTLQTVPATLPEAVVAVEDRRFWQHGGHHNNRPKPRILARGRGRGGSGGASTTGGAG